MEELIEQLNRANVRYLVIGGQAARLSGIPRFSMDWDLYIPPRDHDNLTRLNSVLADQIDVPVVPLGERGQNVVQTYQTRWGIVQFHLGGPGLPKFDDAESRLVKRPCGNCMVNALCDADLLASKLAANRPQDQIDIEFLEEKLGVE
jgi:hypothetical protein